MELNNQIGILKMMQNQDTNNILRIVLFTILLSCSFFTANAQEETPDKIAERFFMPVLQMGNINHNSKNISPGLLSQTSLDYRTKNGLLFRINYDNFRGTLNLKYPNNQTYIGKTPITELIGGLGYRLTRQRGNYFIIVQSGVRFYEKPIIENTNGKLTIEQKEETIGIMRYTLGYEYEVFERVFLNSEIFVGNLYTTKDYWTNERPYFGITLGISSRLF